ncbi:Fc.00g077270.m01.CDS01 [Cosmosporella sp. VM-42]
MAGSEPFPLLNTSAEQLHNSSNVNANADAGGSRRRRKSSALSGALHVGDTGAPALASSRASLNANEKHHHHADGSSSKRLSKRRRARGVLSRVRQTCVKHTFVLPAAILAVMLSAYGFNPSPSNPLHHFIFLSYKLPQDDPSMPVHYGKGRWDIAFVVFYTVVLSFTREFVMQEMLKPLARWYRLSKSKQARFMEQMYTAIYFAILGPSGLYVMSRTPVWYFNTAGMYENFPHKTHEACVKFYYLFQAAYWAQQAIVLVLGMEKPRKDFKELVGHHIVSLSLIGLSYRFHFTYIGLAVYVTHDISDFFLATSKSLSYIDHPLVGPYFVLFMMAWIYLRHVINLKIIWSLLTEFETVGPFEVNWETEQYKCRLSQYITTALLSALQCLNLFWLYCIGRIAWRFATASDLADDRSDDEEEDEPVTPVTPEKKVNGLVNGHSNGHANNPNRYANGKIIEGEKS